MRSPRGRTVVECGGHCGVAKGKSHPYSSRTVSVDLGRLLAESSIWYDHGGTYPEKNVSATSNHGFTVARHTRTANIDDPTRVTAANRKVVCQPAPSNSTPPNEAPNVMASWIVAT